MEATSQELEQNGNEGFNTEPDNNEALTGKDGTKLLRDCSNTRVRTRAENNINYLPGVKRNAEILKTHLTVDRNLLITR